ncbi:MAG: hypothetical protein DSZ23_04560 [Thermodesulfatator sp.]|nr:MAG: hypothetical protein DSZ23_04560 [Thermodesulfatator sp.]
MADSVMGNKKRFTRLIQVWGIIFILGVAFTITAVDVIGSWQDLEVRSRQMRKEYISRQKDIIRQEVLRVVHMISSQRTQAEKFTREKIRHRVLEACIIARNLYFQNKDISTDSQIQKMIIEALRPIRFEQGSGYYFITRLDGLVIMNADRPQLEGLNYNSWENTEKIRIYRTILEIAKEKGEGFFEYSWFKPGFPHEQYKKISFFKVFKPYDWVIGTGLYWDDIENQLKGRLLSTISGIRFGKEGYIFINRFDGEALVSNGKVFSGHRKLWEVFDKHPERTRELFKKEYAAALKKNGDYIYYTHIKLTDPNKEAPKVSFIFGIPELKWLVGAGVYLDDVEKDIAAMQQELNRQIRNKLIIFALIAFAVAAFFLFLFNRLNMKLRDDIILFMRFFNRAARSSEPIDRSRVQFLELDHIARYANKMIADRKRAEDALRQSEAKFRDLVETSSDLIWEMAVPDLEITYIGPQVKKILGYAPEEVVGTSLDKYMTPEELKRISSIIADLTKTGESVKYMEQVLLHKDGHRVVVETSGVPFFDKKGKIVGYRGVARDITQRKQAEKELRKMQKLKSVGTLAGGIAHDFNNILTGIFGNLEIARFKLSPDHSAYPFLEKAGSALEKATNLTKQLLTFARGGDPVLEAVDLKELLKSCVRFNLTGSNIKANFNIQENLWNIRADKGQIDQVISNLVINAKHAMPEGGNLYVEAENIPDIHMDSLSHLSGDYVRMVIRDEGVGISARHIDRIFEPYFSTKQTGSGLGLATAHSIIVKHGGHISVASVPDEGTVFTVFLPAEKESVGHQGMSDSLSAVDDMRLFKARILIMDDDDIVSKVTSAMLKKCGCAYDLAVDGQEALEKYAAAMKDGGRFDAVIMDLTIPGGMGGREAAQRILEMDPMARLIVASGYSTDPIMANYQKYGFMGRLVKPFRFRDLEIVLSRVLKG